MVSMKRMIPLLITLLLSPGLMMCGGGGGSNNDASTLQISSLTLSSGTEDIPLSPVFAQDTAAYTAMVTNDITDVDVITVTDPSDATVTVSGNTGLHVGANIVQVTITSGTDTLSYTISITREQSASAQLSIDSLTLSADGSPVTLDPVFDPNEFLYAAEVPNDATSVDVVAVTDPATATVTVTGNMDLVVGANTVTVTIESGDESLTYIITVTRDVPPLEITALTLSADGAAVALTPAFSQGTTAYTAGVGPDVSSVTVEVTRNYAEATVTVTGNTGLLTGDNTVTVTVSHDSESYTYTITITKDVKLGVSGITVTADGNPEISPSFVETTTFYTASVASTVSSADIAATVTPAGATITGDGTLALVEGNNTAVITASYNGQTAVYTVVVYRAHDYSDEDTGGPFTLSQISLTDLEIERTANGKTWSVPLSPEFSGGVYAYTASVPADTTTVTLSPDKQDSLVYNSNCDVVVNGTEMDYSGTVTINNLTAGLNTIEIVLRRRASIISGTIVATRVYTVYLTVSEQTFDCTACATTGYDYPACTSTDAPGCSGNYAMNQQTFREYDYMMGKGYVDGQVNICDDFTDFLEGEMYGTGGVIPATGKIVDSGSFSNGDFFTVEWYGYDECYQKAYDSLNSLLSLIGGLLPSYFNVSNVMNFDFYGYSRMQVVGVLNTTDFPGIPTDDAATADVDENIAGQFCIIHLMDMPTRAEAEAVPFFSTDAEIAAVVSYYARYNPDDPATTGTPPAGYENIRKIYFLTPGAK